MPLTLFGRKDRKGMDYKARLEHKLYLARENPEPVFDLSDCALKSVPSGIYSLCKVFRKDALYLQDNQLSSLSGGGSLQDLILIQILNIERNHFVSLPSDINALRNLQILKVNNNRLKTLPESIGELSKLQEFDVSNNNLKHLPTTMGNLKRLQILDVRSNKLKALPKELCTAFCLREIHVDCDLLIYPPKEVTQKGTEEMMKFLCQENGTKYVNPSECVTDDSSEASSSPLNISELQERDKLFQEQKQLERLAVERELEEQQKKEVELQLGMKLQKEKLLEELVEEQNKLESEINRIQHQRELEHNQLIQQIQQVESTADTVIKQLILLSEKERMGSLALQQLAEKEREEEERLLNVFQEEQFSLRRRDILHAMEDLLVEECKRELKIREYEEGRAETTRTLLSQEMEADQHLGALIRDRGQERSELVKRLQRDAELQRAAVGALLERGDARSWGLAQEVALVQAQLADLTAVELERRRLEMNEQLVDLSEQRTALSSLLVDLISQQAERRRQLLGQLEELEQRNKYFHSSEDFWLFQYQRLLDSRPLWHSDKTRSIDPNFVRHLLLAGALHCLPLLAHTLLTPSPSSSSLPSSAANLNLGLILHIDHDSLVNAGVTDSKDREAILRAIQEYNAENTLHHENITRNIAPPSAPAAELLENSPEQQAIPCFIDTSHGMSQRECAVCLDMKCEVIFIPCGHMCCCSGCSEQLDLCPLCRALVEQKIRVIPS
ncbi:E3 ubiquitin-protein ligase LRSAM1-like isoform X2 [Ischnura elegans]|uniref:E3 ubiquitin-protein ligase LRSAM1-like isoform X2 n=1 Tax=Ischnura elegans TaxID=197161 RepID=UPI001ED8A6FB|nr:E3 ubiquitin-protein ligase LRSAM1-like isoform X2 [Ischnura elegans]